MSRVPLGKVLLRNVIRHTDAHNKIQEESEMWKIREMEKQTEEVLLVKRKSSLSNSSSSRMRSDGFDEGSQHNDWKVRDFAPVSVTTEDDLRHARYWNRKLYECEANMPDRWGHSGYKELYPEEFDTDSDQRERDEQNSLNGKRKSQPGRRTSLELHKKKKAKKSHKKKRKKKSHKKQKKKKKKKKEQLSTASDSSEESECSEAGASGTGKHRRQHLKKAKKAPTKQPASSSGQDSDSSGSEDSEPRGKPEKQPKKKRRKRCASTSERCSEGVPEKRSKRKNWKVAADENSEDSSDED